SVGEISVKTGNNARNGGKNSLNRLIRCVCGKKIGPDPRNFNQRVSLGRNDLLIRTFPNEIQVSSEKVITIDEALNALVCANGTPSAVVTLKSQRGKFFENLDGSLYRSTFNSSVSGVKVINVVNFNKMIERKVHEKLASINRQRDKKLYGILTHGNRYLSAMMFKLDDAWKSRTIAMYDEDEIERKFNALTSTTEIYLTQFHDGAYLARLFTNVEKTTATMSYIQNYLAQLES
ncbi:hypothetical protein LWU69_22510, partial [Enterobacter hormaechei]|nr:hypothetical protein [Enterobacter hormaechei]